jgi:hypothetical protein
VAKNEADKLLVYILSYFKSKIFGVGLGRDHRRVTPCVLVTEEAAEPGEDDTFYETWPALPPLNVCSPPTTLASGRILMLSIQIRLPTPSRPAKVKASERDRLEE